MGAPIAGKHVLERLLCAAGVPRLGAAWYGGRIVVLSYHNIVPDGERPCGDVSLHLPRRMFARQLDVLQQTHDVVPVTALWSDGPLQQRPRAVLTFDDAYLGTVTEGVAELTARGLPGTIFAIPGRLGGQPFWWDEFADPEHGLDERFRRVAILALAGRQELVHAWAARQGRKPRVMPSHATTASEDQLLEAASRPGVTVGSHSWSHPHLGGLGLEELRAEVDRPLAWLRARLPAAVPALTYPYGLDGVSVRGAAAAAGYRVAFRVTGGWLPGPARPDDFALPRLNIPSGLSTEGYRLRVCGVVGG